MQDYVLCSDVKLSVDVQAWLRQRYSISSTVVLGSEIKLDEKREKLLTWPLRPRIIYVISLQGGRNPSIDYTRTLMRYRNLQTGDRLVVDPSTGDAVPQNVLINIARFSPRAAVELPQGKIASFVPSEVQLVTPKPSISVAQAAILNTPSPSGPGVIVGNISSQLNFLCIADPSIIASLKSRWWLIGVDDPDNLQADETMMTVARELDSMLTERAEIVTPMLPDVNVYSFSEIRGCPLDLANATETDARKTYDCATVVNAMNFERFVGICSKIQDLDKPISIAVITAKEAYETITAKLTEANLPACLPWRIFSVESYENIAKVLEQCRWGWIVGDDRPAQARSTDFLTRGLPLLASSSIFDKTSFLTETVAVRLDENEPASYLASMKVRWKKLRDAVDEHNKKHSIGFYEFNAALINAVNQDFVSKGWKFKIEQSQPIDHNNCWFNTCVVPLFIPGELRFR